MHQESLTPGSMIKHYEVIRPIGEGGMGSVILARDTKLGRLVAIKFLIKDSGTASEDLLAEARATARCRHDNIVVIHEVDALLDRPYIVLEYLEGQTLRTWMKERSGPKAGLPIRVAVETMLPVMRALVCAHALGIVHRDLKPENVLVTATGSVKVLDFGFATRIESAGRAASESATAGTLPYMAPEQWLGEGVDAQSDLWAIGIILYELVIGAHPLAPTTVPRLMKVAHLATPMPSAHERHPDLGALGELIDWCLQKQKFKRIGSAQQLLETLERFAREAQAQARAPIEDPFAGLSAFQENDANRFFGRDSEVTEVVNRLRYEPLMAITGPSGAGKSSFIRAGVIPSLKQSDERWQTFTLRPGRQPLAVLMEILEDHAPKSRDNEDLSRVFHEQPGRLGAALRARCRHDEQRILLFIDQFEELYTLGTRPEERAAFLACLGGVADDASSPLRVVISMRSDFLDRLADDRAFGALVTRGLFLLPALNREGLRAALVKPVEGAGHRFDDDELISEMLDALGQTRSPLPLLQFTAAKLWESRDRLRKTLTRASYVAVGGIAGALSTHADMIVAGMSSGEQRIARAIVLRLVTPERTRAIVSTAELRELAEDGNAVEQVIQQLASARLLVIESVGEGATVEIVHESLIDRWGKLRQWLDESNQDTQFLARVRSAAQQWDKGGQAQGLLWRDQTATEAQQWLARKRDQSESETWLGKREDAYLRAVVALAERSRRVRRAVVAGTIAALGTVAVVVSYLAIRAADEARRAHEEARQARNATRMAAARELQNDPTLVLAILREIEGPDVPRGWAELTRWALCAGVAPIVLSHSNPVTRAAFSPDGKRIITASTDAIARIWNADGQTPPVLLRGHNGILWTAAFSSDGKRILTASVDRTIRMWDADSLAELSVLHDRIATAALSPDGQHIVGTGGDDTARIWSVDGKAEPLLLRGHQAIVPLAAFSPDGAFVVTASADKTARIWRADGTGEPIVLRGHEQSVGWAEFAPDGKRIVTASSDKTARVWNTDGASEPLILRGHDEEVSSAVFSHDGKYVVTGSSDKTARVWNANGKAVLKVLRGHDDLLRSAAFSPDDTRVVTASFDTTARVWRVDTKTEPSIIGQHGSAVRWAAFSPDGKQVVSTSAERNVLIWNVDGSGAPIVLNGHTERGMTAVFSPDGQHVATASHDKTVRVWNADGSGEPVILQGHTDRVASAMFSPDDKRIVSASDDKTIRVWNADGSGEASVFHVRDAMVRFAAFSPDGQHIVASFADKTIMVVRVDGTGEPRFIGSHEDEIITVFFSPDGEHIVSASRDKTAKVWPKDGSSAPVILRGHENWVLSAAFSPDGKQIVTASQDKTVRVWNADGTGEPLVLRSAAGGYNHAAFSPDGKRIVAASDDKTVSIWSDLEPLHGPNDPRLWTATSYCIPIERRMRILGVSASTAQADFDSCDRRVEQAQTNASTIP